MIKGRRVAEWPEQNPGKTILAIGVLFVAAYTLALFLLRKPDGRVVVGDAAHYYVYLRSATFDRDLDFQNDYVRLYRLTGNEPGTEWVYLPTETGHVRNMMSIGPPLIWAPLYLLTVGLVASLRLLGIQYPIDGFGTVFQASAGYSGILASTIGAFVTFKLAEAHLGRRIAIWSTLLIWLGSSAVYYSAISPAYSHSSSMLVVSLFLYVWATTRTQSVARFAAVGSLIGLSALVRWQDAVFLIIPCVEIAQRLWRSGRLDGFPHGTSPLKSVLRGTVLVLACVMSAAVVFSPQIWAWMTLYGRPLAMPQGSHWMQWTSPHLIEVLFSDWHGLFTWTPVLLPAVCGLFWLCRDNRELAIPLVVAFLVSLYANAVVIEWWGGEAYGARRFVSCFPIFVLGIGSLMKYLTLPAVAVGSATVVACNGLLLLQYQAFMHGLGALAPYPGGFYNLALARFIVPFKLIAYFGRRLLT